jgi:hypothetical protein
VRKQNSLDGYRWVEVGKKIQLQSGEEIELNQPVDIKKPISFKRDRFSRFITMVLSTICI